MIKMSKRSIYIIQRRGWKQTRNDCCNLKSISNERMKQYLPKWMAIFNCVRNSIIRCERKLNNLRFGLFLQIFANRTSCNLKMFFNKASFGIVLFQLSAALELSIELCSAATYDCRLSTRILHLIYGLYLTAAGLFDIEKSEMLTGNNLDFSYSTIAKEWIFPRKSTFL